MARPKGSRSAAYVARREELLAKAAEVLVHAYPARPSFREIAAACEISQPTLRHYFGSREGLIAAHLERFGAEGAPYLALMADTALPLAASLREAAMMVIEGFSLPVVGTAQALALSEGLAEAATGPDYLAHVLEPSLLAVAARLRLHVARGEMRPCDPRAVALMLVSPLILACLHQDHLGGRDGLPLDRTALALEVARAVLRAYALPQPPATPDPP